MDVRQFGNGLIQTSGVDAYFAMCKYLFPTYLVHYGSKNPEGKHQNQ